MASLICPRASHVRSVAPKMRSVTVYKATRSPFSTAYRPLTQPASRARPPQSQAQRHIPSRISPSKLLAPSALLARHASSSSSSTSPPSANTTSEEVLTWDRFFDLRRKRRYVNLASSVITSATAVGILAPVIAQQDLDGWAAQVSGFDPIVVLALTTFAVAGLGWLSGPTFGSTLFKVWAGRKGWNQPIVEKETSFFARVRRYRADPSSSSPQNPIPDYYGEKIRSVKDYRRWLKDQRAFNLKKNKNMI